MIRGTDSVFWTASLRGFHTTWVVASVEEMTAVDRLVIWSRWRPFLVLVARMSPVVAIAHRVAAGYDVARRILKLPRREQR